MYQCEIEALTTINHANVLRCFEHGQETLTWADGSTRLANFMILELCPYGDVFDYVCQTGKLDQNIARFYMRQLLGAMNEIHSHGISHRDMKVENIFVNDQFHFKVGDFGSVSYTHLTLPTIDSV